MVGTSEAREIIGKAVSWLDGNLNHITFNRLVDSGLLPVAYLNGKTGQKYFERKTVEALAKKFPVIRPQNRIGIVGWIQGKRPKTKAKGGKR